MKKNGKAAIVIPCHRVINSNGELNNLISKVIVEEIPFEKIGSKSAPMVQQTALG